MEQSSYVQTHLEPSQVGFKLPLSGLGEAVPLQGSLLLGHPYSTELHMDMEEDLEASTPYLSIDSAHYWG